MAELSLGFYILYLFFILCFYFLIKKPVYSKQKSEKRCASVIVCAHNEEQYLINLLDSLLIQDYQLDKIQFLFVNDRSVDGTEELFLHYATKLPNAEVISISELPQDKFGKKNALETAITKASHDILLFTDADCICSINWISSTLELYDDDTACVVGNSPLHSTRKSWIQHFQESETFFSHIIAYVSIALKSPVMSFGRNFSYRKSVFESLDGFKAIEKSMSGDDDLMLDQIRRHKLNVKYNTDAYVPSPPMLTFKDFMRQKTRHLSAVRYFSIGYQVMATVFHGAHLATYLVLHFISYGYILFGVKLSLDYFLFKRMNHIYRSKYILREYFYYEIAYLPYVFVLTIRGYFAQMKQMKW